MIGGNRPIRGKENCYRVICGIGLNLGQARPKTRSFYLGYFILFYFFAAGALSTIAFGNHARI